MPGLPSSLSIVVFIPVGLSLLLQLPQVLLSVEVSAEDVITKGLQE